MPIPARTPDGELKNWMSGHACINPDTGDLWFRRLDPIHVDIDYSKQTGFVLVGTEPQEVPLDQCERTELVVGDRVLLDTDGNWGLAPNTGLGV